MNPRQMFCPNPDCVAKGQVGRGNITIHSPKEQRYKCNACQKTFSARHGTPFYRRRVSEEVITCIVTLCAYGCPVAAIVAAFGYQARTVGKWLEQAGVHCREVHEQVVSKGRDLGQVQADELYVKMQKGRFWMALALQMCSRLWLGGVIGPHRDKSLLYALAERIRRCAIEAPLLLVTDGFTSYIDCFRRAFRRAICNGKVGRNKRVSWQGLVVAQVVKAYKRGGKRTSALGARFCRVAVGTFTELAALLKKTQQTPLLHTAYIERLNATFRSRLAGLARRTRCLLRLKQRM